MIITERLRLRPIISDDSEAVFQYRSDSETNKYQGWIPATIKEVEEFIAKNPSEFNLHGTWYQLIIIEVGSEIIVGDIGVRFIDEHQCEVGCTLDKNYQGKGYATESLKGVIDYLFDVLNKHRITASVDPLNLPSIIMVERLGFRKEGHFIKSLLIGGEWVDDIIYAVLKSDWK